MPRPLPDYLPPEVRAWAENNETHLKDLACAKQLHRARFYSFFGSSHIRVKPYKRLAEWLGIDLDALRLLIEQRKLEQAIKAKFEDPKVKESNHRELAKFIGATDGWIYNRYTETQNTCLDGYNAVANVFGWSIEKLVSICI